MRNYVWEMDEAQWKEFADAIDRRAFDVAYMAGEYLGCCRVGDLCFDIRSWDGGDWTGWGFELFCGGVDSGYGYSAKEAMESGGYVDKYCVPLELQYPYDEVEYGEFPEGFCSYTMTQFQREAEKIFELFIEECAAEYDKADLLRKADEALHLW